MSCVVKTQFGEIQGNLSDGIYSFMGVPYAQPPVGELRFRPAQPLKPWDGILNCTCPRPMAMQCADETDIPGEPYHSDFFFDGLPEQSEDCLYLNVTTNNLEGKRPVYVWFHGGGLNTGFSYEHEFNPESFARKGVVVVSVAQRLNVFGYLALKQLESDGQQSGNYGLTDQLQAFHWIWDNIAAFGGDPENITLGGQSGGTSKVIALTMACKKAKDGKMPRRLVLESGLKWSTVFDPIADAEKRGREYLCSIGLNENISADELRQLPALSLMSKHNRLLPGTMIFDDKLFDYPSVREAAMAGEFDDIDMIIGTNLGESVLPPINSEGELETMWKNMTGCDVLPLRQSIGLERSPADAARIMGTYGLCENVGPNQSRNLMVARQFANLIQEHGGTGRIYVYLFTRYPPTTFDDIAAGRRREELWAWHAAELWYSFNSLRKNIPPIRPWEDADFILSNTMNDYWTNFMYCGNPTDGPQSMKLEWPLCNETGAYIQFDSEVQVHNEHFTDRWTRDFVRKAYGFS